MSGVFIAGMGLPGSGKSTIMGALSSLINSNGLDSTIYKEPEEENWADCIKIREVSGYLTALTWFRSIRVPNIYKAKTDALNGKIAVLDSYYDKLIHLYFDRPNFEWLMPKIDPYREVYKEIIKIDYETLPDCDCVVFFRVTPDRWRALVDGRGRELDRSSNLKDFHATQEDYFLAVEQYCNSKQIKLVNFENNQANLSEAAKELFEVLKKLELINE